MRRIQISLRDVGNLLLLLVLILRASQQALRDIAPRFRSRIDRLDSIAIRGAAHARTRRGAKFATMETMKLRAPAYCGMDFALKLLDHGRPVAQLLGPIADIAFYPPPPPPLNVFS